MISAFGVDHGEISKARIPLPKSDGLDDVGGAFLVTRPRGMNRVEAQKWRTYQRRVMGNQKASMPKFVKKDPGVLSLGRPGRVTKAQSPFHSPRPVAARLMRKKKGTPKIKIAQTADLTKPTTEIFNPFPKPQHIRPR